MRHPAIESPSGGAIIPKKRSRDYVPCAERTECVFECVLMGGGRGWEECVAISRRQSDPSALCLTCCFHFSATSSHLVNARCRGEVSGCKRRRRRRSDGKTEGSERKQNSQRR